MSALKDAALAAALRRLVNAKIGFGEITELSLDTKQRRARALLELEGEEQPIGVEIRSFDLVIDGDRSWIVVHDAVASRKWLTLALRQFLIGTRFPLPENAATFVRMVM